MTGGQDHTSHKIEMFAKASEEIIFTANVLSLSLGWPQHQWVYRGTDADGDGPLPRPQRVPPHPFPRRPKIC